MSLRQVVVIGALLLGLLFALPVRAQSPVDEISEELICQCGCNLLLSDCDHAVCRSRDEMTALISQKLAQGQSKSEIIQSFVDQYGEQVLAVPTKRGFNLVAWILPFGALMAGGGVVYTLLRAWVRQGKRRLVSDMAEVGEEDEEYGRRLEKELEEFIER
jgi:cytochrome c-type biogenesis protein CcmH